MKQKLPLHVAIVMDGNGRWAEKRGLLRVEGHRAGIEPVKIVIQSCLEKKIKFLSLFAFSSENWLRPKNEIDFLMQLFVSALQEEIKTLHEHGVCLKFTGDKTKLKTALQEEMRKAELLTKNNENLFLNIAVNYSGRWDIIQAIQTCVNNISQGYVKEEISEQLLESFLDTKGIPDPDLFIRTSGEKRISNFFLWQLAYTELYFSDLHWPDFNEEEFAKALLSYSKRERRFGKISEQLIENKIC